VGNGALDCGRKEGIGTVDGKNDFCVVINWRNMRDHGSEAIVKMTTRLWWVKVASISAVPYPFGWCGDGWSHINSCFGGRWHS
jgi:hypothetical protein